MAFDFDKPVNRWNTNSLKWDAMTSRTGVSGQDAIAMWVADMDFEAPPAVKEALRQEVERSIHGYYSGDLKWRETVNGWLSRRHNWQPDPNWIIPTPGIVSALGLILQAFSEENDHIVVFSPVYHAFGKIIAANNRRIHEQPLINEQGRYRMDFEGLAASLPDNARIVFFCSPHNPGGRVWEKEEIQALCEFCIERDLILVSDEIHNDLVYEGYQHHVTAKVLPEIEDRLITCCAASKTFNLAGAHVGATIISNQQMRKKFKEVCARSGLLTYPLFGMIATEAALAHGDEWLDVLLPYLQANRDFLAENIAKAIPGARPMHLEATYLSWVDFSQTDYTSAECLNKITNEAKIAVNDGPTFGLGGENWLRFNFATQRAVINEAIQRLGNIFSEKN